MALTPFVVVHDFNEYLEMTRDCNQSIIEKLFSSDKVLYLKYFSISPQKREFESNIWCIVQRSWARENVSQALEQRLKPEIWRRRVCIQWKTEMSIFIISIISFNIIISVPYINDLVESESILLTFRIKSHLRCKKLSQTGCFSISPEWSAWSISDSICVSPNNSFVKMLKSGSLLMGLASQ